MPLGITFVIHKKVATNLLEGDKGSVNPCVVHSVLAINCYSGIAAGPLQLLSECSKEYMLAFSA